MIGDEKYFDDPMPFVEFMRERLASYEGHLHVMAAALGTGPKSIAAWTADPPRDPEGAPLERVLIRTVDRICTAAGVPLAELYPFEDGDDVAIDAYCPACREATVCGPDATCLWCGGDVTVERHRCPRCNGFKAARAKRCRECFNREGFHGGRTKLTKISEEALAAAYSLYQRGLSIDETARRILPFTKYKNFESCQVSLRQNWAARGWKLRPNAEESAKSNRRRRHPDRCSHVFKIGPRKGAKCDTVASKRHGNGLCDKHQPDYMAAKFAHLTARRAEQREQVAA